MILLLRCKVLLYLMLGSSHLPLVLCMAWQRNEHQKAHATRERV